MDIDFWLLILVGILAQLIDGSLGMAYGVSSNSFLIGVGVPPAVASASVHTAEVFTTAISGFSHWRLGNIDRRIVLGLIIPGVVGTRLELMSLPVWMAMSSNPILPSICS